MASPNLAPISPGANGSFNYMLNLVNNVAALANAGVYTNGVITSPNANVVIDGKVTADFFVVQANAASITFKNDAGVSVGAVSYSANGSIRITSANTSGGLELFANGLTTSANSKIATTDDIASTTNAINASIVTQVNTALVAAKAYTDLRVPTGTILMWAGNTAPSTYYEANGGTKSRTTDAALFAVIGTTFGAPNTTTFSLPQLQGEFVRGWDNGRGVDNGRTLGSFQADDFKSHTHTGTTVSAGSHAHTATTDSQGSHTHTAATDSQGNHSHTGTTDTQGNHSHGVNDPGHVHDWGNTAKNGGNPSGAGGAFITGGSPGSLFTTQSSTGVSIQNSGSHAHNLNVDVNGAHTHTVNVNAAGAHTHSVTVAANGAHTHTFTTDPTGGLETRPRNVALMYIIKA